MADITTLLGFFTLFYPFTKIIYYKDFHRAVALVEYAPLNTVGNF